MEFFLENNKRVYLFIRDLRMYMDRVIKKVMFFFLAYR